MQHYILLMDHHTFPSGGNGYKNNILWACVSIQCTNVDFICEILEALLNISRSNGGEYWIKLYLYSEFI